MPSKIDVYQIGVWFCAGFFTGAGLGDCRVARRTDLLRDLSASADWTDCHFLQAPKVDPLEALAKIRSPVHNPHVDFAFWQFKACLAKPGSAR
jgi:hypothetical protein